VIHEAWLSTHKAATTSDEDHSAEGLVAGLAQDVHDGLEGKPLGDILAGTEESAELCARELRSLVWLQRGSFA